MKLSWNNRHLSTEDGTKEMGHVWIPSLGIHLYTDSQYEESPYGDYWESSYAIIADGVSLNWRVRFDEDPEPTIWLDNEEKNIHCYEAVRRLVESLAYCFNPRTMVDLVSTIKQGPQETQWDLAFRRGYTRDRNTGKLEKLSRRIRRGA